MKTKISISINEKTLDDIDSMIDNVYIRNRSQAIELLAKKSFGENKNAVILAGGPEEGLLLSDGQYRPIAKIKGKRLVERAVLKLREHNFRNIYVIARGKVLTSIFDILKEGNEFGVKVNYIDEKDSRGTADSLRQLKGKIRSNFLVVYADLLFEKVNLDSLWNSHLKNSSVATVILTTSDKPSEKGTIKAEGNRIMEFRQKPKKSEGNLVFSAIFVADSGILEYPGSSLEDDCFPVLAEKGLLYGHLSSEKVHHIHTLADIKKL